MPDLTIHYEGYWQCRQATDPDPSREPRGASGYVLSTGWENDLDQIIRLQRDEIDPRDFRAVPGDPSSERFGVFVTSVTLAGAPRRPGAALRRLLRAAQAVAGAVARGARPRRGHPPGVPDPPLGAHLHRRLRGPPWPPGGVGPLALRPADRGAGRRPPRRAR